MLFLAISWENNKIRNWRKLQKGGDIIESGDHGRR
jgi:hypothetical protein